MNIFLLEDNESEVSSFKETALRLSSELNIGFNIYNYPNLSDSAYAEIFKTKFDHFIVDLKLEGDSGQTRSGNDFLVMISKGYHIPVSINSAVITDLDEDFSQESNPLVRQFSQSTSSTEEVLRHVHKIYKTGISKVLGNDGIIGSTLSSLVFKGLLGNIERWGDGTDQLLAQKSLSRYVLSHLHHNLSGDYDNFNPEETYLMVDDGKFDTGSIVKKGENFFILLTPACDIANNKFLFYKLYRINPLLPNLNSDRHKSIADGKVASKHFLPQSSIFPSGGYIDYEHSVSVPKEVENVVTDAEEVDSERSASALKEDIRNYEIICLVSPDFLKDVVFRLGAYYGRQGSPNVSQ